MLETKPSVKLIISMKKKFKKIRTNLLFRVKYATMLATVLPLSLPRSKVEINQVPLATQAAIERRLLPTVLPAASREKIKMERVVTFPPEKTRSELVLKEITTQESLPKGLFGQHKDIRGDSNFLTIIEEEFLTSLEGVKLLLKYRALSQIIIGLQPQNIVIDDSPVVSTILTALKSLPPESWKFITSKIWNFDYAQLSDTAKRLLEVTHDYYSIQNNYGHPRAQAFQNNMPRHRQPRPLGRDIQPGARQDNHNRPWNPRFHINSSALEMGKKMTGIEIQQMFTLPGGKGKFKIESNINATPGLLAEAIDACKNQRVTRDFNPTITRVNNGNVNPGIGNRHIKGTTVTEFRTDSGARIYFRRQGNVIQIVAISAKANQDPVIDKLRSLYSNKK